MTGSLTVVTLNTWKCDGAYWRRLPLMARALAEAAPDVVFLQEVLRAPEPDGADTSARLAAATGLRAHDAPARPGRRLMGARWVDSWSGLTILSRWPLRTERLPLPVRDGGGDWDRLALIGRGETPFGPLILVNLHLTHPPADTVMRGRQMEILLDHLAATAGAPVILGGDFNDRPGSPPLDSLAKDARWTARNAVPASGGAFFATAPDNTGDSIDHLFLLQAPGTPPWRVVSAGAVGDWREDGVAPSDHIGVRAVFRPPTGDDG
jgi:endonuclease/exonuclease/phosphatase family metal-dependent hydrolase